MPEIPGVFTLKFTHITLEHVSVTPPRLPANIKAPTNAPCVPVEAISPVSKTFRSVSADASESHRYAFLRIYCRAFGSERQEMTSHSAPHISEMLPDWSRQRFLLAFCGSDCGNSDVFDLPLRTIPLYSRASS
jgi:hypothetical protein